MPRKKTPSKRPTAKKPAPKKPAPKKTPAKKTPAKKPTVTSGKKTPLKKSVNTPKKGVSTKPTVTSGKKTGTKVNRRRSTKKEYLTIGSNAKSSKFYEYGEKVQKGEIEWSHALIENDLIVHYYEIIKK